MNKQFKLIIKILLMIISGRYYYSILTNEYCYKFVDQKKIQNLKTNTLGIGTYNIKSLNYGKNDLKSFNKDIIDLKLDIICLQEVDKNSLRSGNFDMLKIMANSSGYCYYYFYPTMWILSGYYGLGILSKYSIIEVMAQRLPNSIIREPRILTRTKLYFNEQIITIYNTYLTYADNQYRIKQMDYVKKHVDFNSYSILAGDFNSFKMNNKFKMEGVKCINENKKYKTFCEFAAPDNIFYADFFELKNCGLKKSSFSDHDLLYGEFFLKG